MSDETQKAIRKVCMDLANFLCDKNEAYGDSAVNPIRIRSKASSLEQILVRQDDKLNRLYNGREFAGDDDLKDLVGYWVLEQVVRERNEVEASNKESFEELIERVSDDKDEAGVIKCNPKSCAQMAGGR